VCVVVTFLMLLSMPNYYSECEEEEEEEKERKTYLAGTVGTDILRR
jgi:hypothetical protein